MDSHGHSRPLSFDFASNYVPASTSSWLFVVRTGGTIIASCHEFSPGSYWIQRKVCRRQLRIQVGRSKWTSQAKNVCSSHKVFLHTSRLLGRRVSTQVGREQVSMVISWRVFYCFANRHVILPKDLAKTLPKSRLLTESEWRGIGVQQSRGWQHYAIHRWVKEICTIVGKDARNM